ncbi:SDR family oxidoreductase [Ramlibacter rhizophilus]|uniref:SDR family oxidoreductase n=1 Tax=Ramlibacter rhizophilus TaxID=1781167 RepID=A0A4Z0C027_9BURK|nr:SDR family oxidoreductase [Ramlibacter rhizophilus]TFZ04282.1 SDR family oxidoreductase [Ramlibacter rhizophilus]
MRVLITGATGFIGRRLALALLARGHELVCAVRSPERLELGPGHWRAVPMDLAQVPPRSAWREHLAGVDAVVNAVGIIRETPGQGFKALHARAPAELFRACVDTGVPTVVQVSALGADGQARSRYHRSKKAADDALRSLPLKGAIVQPSVVYGAEGASAALFNRMAAAPLLALPQAGRMALQPVHIDDVVEGLVALLESPPPELITLPFVGPRKLTMADYLRRLRDALGIAGPLPVLPLPQWLFLGAAHVAGRLPGSILDAETAGMLLRGNAGPVDGLRALLGRLPREVEDFVPPAAREALRTSAVLGVWLPVLRVALALMWIWTALVSFGLYPVQGSYELLAQVGLTGALATLALYGAATLDLALGVLTLACPPRWRRAMWLSQIVLIGGYTLLITLFLPQWWLHPYGPISKNLPLLAAIGLLWTLEPPPRLRG